MSTVPRHSEEELRQQWAFLDALVDRQASSLRAGSQDPEEEDLPPVVAPPETTYLEEISTLTRRVSTLESERTTLLRRLGLYHPVVASPIAVNREGGEGVEILTHLDYAVYFLAYRLYRSKPVTVPATLYFPEETPPGRLSWFHKASERADARFTVEFLPGDHHTCRECTSHPRP